MRLVSCALLLTLLSVTACSGKQVEPKPAGTAPAATSSAAEPAAPAAASEEPLPPLAYESALSEAVRAELNKSLEADEMSSDAGSGWIGVEADPNVA